MMFSKGFIKTSYISLFILLMCLFFSGAAFAETKTPQKPDICGEIIFDTTMPEYPVDLQDVLTIAMQNNFDIKIFSAQRDRDKWRYYQSVTNWLPDITYEYKLSRIEGAFLVGGIVTDSVLETPIESNFNLKWNFSVKKYFKLKETFYTFNSQKKELEFTKDEVLLRATENYYDLLKQKVGIKILETNIKQIEEQLRINQQKLDAGIGTKFDVLRAQADLSLAEQELIVTKNSYRFAQAVLANTLGLSVFIQLIPDDDDVLVKEFFNDCFNLDQAGEMALSQRDDLASEKFDIEVARQKRNSGYSSYVPEVNITGLLGHQGTHRAGLPPAKRIGLLATWDGLSSLGAKGFTEIKSRNAELQEAELKYINKTRNIKENIVRTYFNTITARELIEATYKELESAKESRRLSVIRLESGVGTFIDVLQAQNTYTDARINHLRAMIGYNISQVELLFEMGVISVNNILGEFNSGVPKLNPNKQKSEEHNKKMLEEYKEEDIPEDEFTKPQK